MFENVNLVAVLVSAIAMMVIAGIWYAPPIFGNAWLKAMKKKKEDIKGAGKAMGVSFIAALVTAYVLAGFIGLAGAATFGAGAMIGFWVWLGFVFATHLVVKMYEDRPWALLNIFMGHELVALLVAGGILAIWT